MNKAQFLESTALECQFLAEGVPVCSLEGSSETYEFSEFSDGIDVHRSLYTNIGDAAVQDLRLRLTALFFGAAWKVLDMAVELALHRVMDQQVPFQAKTKVGLLGQHAGGQMAEVPATIWAALVEMYEATLEIRHALVHRRVEIEGGTLKAASKDGTRLAPVSNGEMVKFCEIVLRMRCAIEREAMTPREQRQCLFLLAGLRSFHGNHLLPALGESAIVRVRFTLLSDGRLPVALIKDRLRRARPGWTGIDLELTDSRTGIAYLADLEAVAEDLVHFDTANPPTWLRRRILSGHGDLG